MTWLGEGSVSILSSLFIASTSASTLASIFVVASASLPPVLLFISLISVPVIIPSLVVVSVSVSILVPWTISVSVSILETSGSFFSGFIIWKTYDWCNHERCVLILGSCSRLCYWFQMVWAVHYFIVFENQIYQIFLWQFKLWVLCSWRSVYSY